VPRLVDEFLVEGATLFQAIDKGLCLEVFRPPETAEQRRGRTRERRHLVAGDREEGSSCWYLLYNHRRGGGGFVFTLLYSGVARVTPFGGARVHRHNGQRR
jgi:hypothetical protein